MTRFLLLVAALLAACASPMRTPPATARSEWRDFTLQARFSLRLESTDGRGQNASGRLSWQHSATTDQLLLADPLGQGVAELESSRAGASLRLANGETRRASDAARLLQDSLGYSLPVAQLPAWLLGRASDSGILVLDAQGRPGQLREAGWQIDYAYEDEAPTSLPARLIIQRPGEIELRLRIEEWR